MHIMVLFAGIMLVVILAVVATTVGTMASILGAVVEDEDEEDM